MAAGKPGLNPTTHSVGFTSKLVTVRSVSADGKTAVTVDRQNTQTSVSMLVQRSKGPLPQPGETWLLTQDLGMWTFAAFVAASPEQFDPQEAGIVRFFRGSVAPEVPQPGDFWFNSGASNQLSIWNGEDWELVLFGGPAIQPGSLTSGNLSPNAGITQSQVSFSFRDIGGMSVTMQSAPPPSPATGDLWYDATHGYVLMQWDGTAWQPYQFGSGAIQARSITAELIAAGTITAEQLAAGIIYAGIINGTTVNAATFTGSVFQGLDFVINSSGIFYYSGTPAAGNLSASVTNSAGTEANGNAYMAGHTTYSGYQPAYHVFTATNNNNGIIGFYTAAGAGGYAGPWTIVTSISMGLSNAFGFPNTYLALGSGGGTPIVFNDPVFGGIAASEPGALNTKEPWHTGAGLNSFTLAPAGYMRFQYRLNPDNTVEVAGCIQLPGVFSAVTFFTLPQAYWPNNVVQWPYTTQQGLTISSDGTGCVQVDAAGNMTLRNNPTGLGSGNVVFVQGRYALGTV